MPTFGDYETVGEPVATRDERGHVSTIWKARKSGESGAPRYAVKCYAPHRKPKEGQPEDALDEDRGLEFLEGIKQLKKAYSEGGRCLAPIHAFGIAAEGAWYVTDFYPRNTLKAWIARRGGVDSAAVRHVLYSIATGCLALKRSRGYSHGNLKSGNVFLVGKQRPLRKTPLHLSDPYPAAPLQLSRLEGDDRHELGELLDKVIEAHDLRAIGELILELVEGRLIQGRYDYNYPVAPSPAWDRLGKDGEHWRQLCNRLLDPQLSPDKVNLESLAKEFRPNPVIAKLPLIVAIVGGICVFTVAGVYATKSIAARAAQKKADLATAAKVQEQRYQTAMTEGKSALEGKDYAAALTQANAALGIKAGDPEATTLRNEAQRQLDLANAAKANEQKYQTAMREGRSAWEGKDYPKAIAQANVALGIKPGDPAATKLKNDAQKPLDQVNTAQVFEPPRAATQTTNSITGRSRDDVSKLDATLDLLDVWFGIDPKNDKRVLDPNTKGLAKPLPFGGLRTDYKEDILRKLDSMEKRYQETGLLDQRKDRIAKLKDKIVNRGN